MRVEGAAAGGNRIARALSADRVGGAHVLRPFDMGGRRRRAGETLTAEEVAAIPLTNLRALVDNRNIDPFPAAAPAADGLALAEARARIAAQAERIRELEAVATAAEPPRHVVHRGRGHYDVIEGRKLNDEPLSQGEAEALATSPR